MQFVGDSQVLIDCLLGSARPHTDGLRRPVSQAHYLLQQLVRSFGVRQPRGRELAMQVARADNAAADSAANEALDAGSFRTVDDQESLRFWLAMMTRQDLSSEIGLLFAFDGASRGNPGLASFGVCAWWGTWADEGFCESGALLRRGLQIGTATNNMAEAEAMAAAIREAVRWHFEVLGELCRHVRGEFSAD
jgi:ribonuclease HI